MDTSAFETILADDYLGDLTVRPLEEIRAKRAECQELELGLSYLRRVVQGRLDIVAAESARRRDGGEPVDLHAMVERLPEILGGQLRAPGLGRLPQMMAPAAGGHDLMAEVDEVASEEQLSKLPGLSDDELASLTAALSELETDVSGRRRRLHERIDALQAELTRRYKSGEASIDSLLSG